MVKRLACALAAFPLAISACAQISLGQVDDFQDGTIMGWTGGTGPTNVADGGPSGVGDRYLRLTSSGASGPGSRLGAFNPVQWSGDYTAAGVDSVSLWVRNPSGKDLELRAVLFSSEGARWTSVNSFAIAADTGWTQTSFSLKEADMALVLGTTPYASLMADVAQLMVRHDAGAPDPTGEVIEAEVHMDNVEAVPEPTTLAAIAMGAVALARRKRRVR